MIYSPDPVQIQQNLLQSGSSPIQAQSNAHLWGTVSRLASYATCPSRRHLSHHYQSLVRATTQTRTKLFKKINYLDTERQWQANNFPFFAVQEDHFQEHTLPPHKSTSPPSLLQEPEQKSISSVATWVSLVKSDCWLFQHQICTLQFHIGQGRAIVLNKSEIFAILIQSKIFIK